MCIRDRKVTITDVAAEGKAIAKVNDLVIFVPYVVPVSYTHLNTILTILMITVMTYEIPKLPYTNNALEHVISKQTIDYHYGKHLQTLSLIHI